LLDIKLFGCSAISSGILPCVAQAINAWRAEPVQMSLLEKKDKCVYMRKEEENTAEVCKMHVSALDTYSMKEYTEPPFTRCPYPKENPY